MKKCCLLALLLLIGHFARAQSVVTGTITASQCLSIDVTGKGVVGISITGSWTGTIQPQVSIGGDAYQNAQVTPYNSGTAQATITANGTFQADITGASTFQVCGATVTNTATVKLQASALAAKLGGGGGAGSTAFSAVTAGSNTVALTEGAGGSLTPTTGNPGGQINAIGNWYDDAPGTLVPPIPTSSVSNTGGSLTQGNYFVRVTYAGPGTVVPSGELRVPVNSTNCASNSTCQITINMPTSCTAGNLPATVTGCTVWDIISFSNTEKQQAASNACVNITTATCVINVAAAGSTITAPASSGVVPSSLTAISQPDLIIPHSYIKIADGTYTPAAGMDFSALNVLTGVEQSGFQAPAIGSVPGTFTWTHRFFFNDTNAAPIISNAMVSIHHLLCQTTGCLTTANTSGVDDRAFAIEFVDGGVASPFVEQKLGEYVENIVTNNAFTCQPINAGTPAGESCVAAGRFVTADQRTANTNATAGYFVGVAGVANSSGATAQASGSTMGYTGVVGGAFQSTNSTNGSAQNWIGGAFGVNASAGNTNGSGYGVKIFGSTTKFASANYALFIDNQFNTTGTSDYAIRSDAASKSNFAGIVDFASIGQNSSTIPVTGALVDTGSLGTAQISTPAVNANLSIVGTTGATTIGYKYVAKDANGYPTATSPLTTIGTANATLDGSHSVTINIPISQQNIGAASFDIYRTQTNGTSPTTTGLIGNVVPGANNILNGWSVSFSDTGIAPGTSSTTPPTSNATGSINSASIVTSLNTQRVTGSNFTTSSASLVPLFTWHLAANKSYSLHCSMTYQQATAAAGFTIGVQAGANTVAAPQNVSATAVIYTNTTGAASTFTTGTLATLATTTATNVLAGGAPAATNTNYYATLDGGFTTSATDPSDFVVDVATANASDQITLLKDATYCQLF